MAALLFLVVMQLAWSFGVSQQARQAGGGAYSYSDSTGQRHSGTYSLRDGQVVHSSGDLPVPFSDAAAFPGLPQPPYNDFGRFGNFGRYGGYPSLPGFEMPNYPGNGFPNNGFPNNAFPNNAYANNAFPNNPYANGGYSNSAFASSAVGPGYRRQVAAINPQNPKNPNVHVNEVNRYSDTSAPGRSNYYSVASKSFTSTSNLNGQQVSRKGAETIVDDNGKVTKFGVHN